jgi:translation initiation factor IF-3
VIDNDGNPLGILPTPEAIQRALEAGFDLVEVAPTADPPVCKIMDYGKFKYEKAKKEKEAKKKQHIMHLKEIKFHPKTDVHDYKFKIDHARKFLIKGDRVKLTVVFRGREIAYKDFGIQLLDRMDQDLADIAVVETRYKMEGKNMISTYVPDKIKVQAVKRKMEKEKALLEKELQEKEKQEVQQTVELKQ